MAAEKSIVYFPEPGPHSTEQALRIARTKAEELGVTAILVASTTGQTAVKATEAFRGMRVIVASHCAGFRAPNTQEFSDETRRKAESNGATVLTATHAFAGLNWSMRKKSNMYLFEDIVANTLRIFGQGTKVACEIAIMAADAGLIGTSEDVISIAGTSSGADTALVVKPVNSQDFFDLKVKEILCKPRFD